MSNGSLRNKSVEIKCTCICKTTQSPIINHETLDREHRILSRFNIKFIIILSVLGIYIYKLFYTFLLSIFAIYPIDMTIGNDITLCYI